MIEEISCVVKKMKEQKFGIGSFSIVLCILALLIYYERGLFNFVFDEVYRIGFLRIDIDRGDLLIALLLSAFLLGESKKYREHKFAKIGRGLAGIYFMLVIVLNILAFVFLFLYSLWR